MADIDLGSTGLVSLVGQEGTIQRGHIPALVDLPAGAVVAIDPTTGKLDKADASTGALNRAYGVTLRAVKAGYGVTVLRAGIMDGFDLSALAYDDPVYLSNTGGAIADAAGDVSVVVGRVVPGTAVTLGTAYDKLLEVELA